MNLHILPLAIAMVAGTQLVLATLIVTGRQPVKASLAYVAGFGVAVAGGLIGMYVAARLLHLGLANHTTEHHRSRIEQLIEIFLIVLLVLLALRAYLRRADAKPSKFLEAVQTAGPSQTFKYGMAMIVVAPTDLIVMASVAVALVRGHGTLLDAAPFWGLCMLLLAAPLILYFAMGPKGPPAMDRVRRFTEEKSWAVTVIVCAVYLALIVS